MWGTYNSRNRGNVFRSSRIYDGDTTGEILKSHMGHTRGHRIYDGRNDIWAQGRGKGEKVPMWLLKYLFVCVRGGPMRSGKSGNRGRGEVPL